jgi:hypothetical protein
MLVQETFTKQYNGYNYDIFNFGELNEYNSYSSNHLFVSKYVYQTSGQFLCLLSAQKERFKYGTFIYCDLNKFKSN